MLGQSIGSLVLAYDAFSLLVPDIFVDTMGYAFTLAFAKYTFPDIPVGAYVHYPTISTDMLGSLDAGPDTGLHAGSGKGLKGHVKRLYWKLFARLYSWVGGHVDVVMANSSWTGSHMRTLWGPSRTKNNKTSEIEVVFPPVAVEELERSISVNANSERIRERSLIYIAQFRPEKNHSIILRAFAELVNSTRGRTRQKSFDSVKLLLVGSVRDDKDETRVYELRLLAHELKIKEQVEFVCNAAWPDIVSLLGNSSIGVNGMWNEHFGIGVVEYQAAGLISVVNDSGGPKEDIVVDHDGGSTGNRFPCLQVDVKLICAIYLGFHASTVSEYATAFSQALSLSPKEALAMRLRARSSAKRFSDEEFATSWSNQFDRLVTLRKQGHS